MDVLRTSGNKPDSPVPGASRRDLRRAWIWVVLAPIGLAVAMLLGEGAVDALGYPAGGDRVAPAWIAGMVSTAVILVGILPGAAAALYGMRARREGLRRGLVPAAIGTLVVLYWIFTRVTGIAGLT
jgi:hypothetical protein